MGVRPGNSSGQKATEEHTEEQLSALITQLTNEIDWYMRARKLTRVDIRPDGCLPGAGQPILSGGENLTLRTLAGVASALDARFDFELKPRQAAAAPEPSDVGRVTAAADSYPALQPDLRFDESNAHGVSARR